MSADGQGVSVRPRLAVLYIHGVEADNDRFAETSIALLRCEFTRIAGVDSEQALVVRTAFWGSAFQERQNELLRRVGARPSFGAFSALDRLAHWAGRGYSLALVAAAATVGARWLRGAPGLHFPTLRWLVVHFLGDAITYEARPSDRELYDRVHQIVAAALHELALEAGSDAPLCIVAHSLGSVVISNFVWDLEVAAGRHPQRAGYDPVAAHVAAELDDTPLERGETLAWLYTRGSPLALWSQRYADFGEPVAVPAAGLSDHHPELDGEWVNVWSPDDVVALPLRDLNDRWHDGVDEDRQVSVSPRWLGWTPAVHPFYWNDRTVMGPIATALARAYHRLRAHSALSDTAPSRNVATTSRRTR